MASKVAHHFSEQKKLNQSITHSNVHFALIILDGGERENLRARNLFAARKNLCENVLKSANADGQRKGGGGEGEPIVIIQLDGLRFWLLLLKRGIYF